MTDALLELVGAWGVWALALTTFLSCLALPVPSSMMMLAAGAFVASGDLALGAVVAGALGGALLGDQVGFALGRRVGQARWLTATPGRAALIGKARALTARHGLWAVFFSRWMFSALGPYVNLVAGGAHMRWARFSLGSVTGESVWVAVYVALGWALGGRIDQIAELASNATGLATSLLIAAILGWLVFRRR